MKPKEDHPSASTLGSRHFDSKLGIGLKTFVMRLYENWIPVSKHWDDKRRDLLRKERKRKKEVKKDVK